MSYCPGAVNILRGRSLTSWGGVITRENGYWATIEDKGAGYEFTAQCPHLCGHCAATENREQYFPFSPYLSYSPLRRDHRMRFCVIKPVAKLIVLSTHSVLTLQPQLTHTKVVTPTIAPRTDKVLACSQSVSLLLFLCAFLRA